MYTITYTRDTATSMHTVHAIQVDDTSLHTRGCDPHTCVESSVNTHAKLCSPVRVTCVCRTRRYYIQFTYACNVPASYIIMISVLTVSCARARHTRLVRTRTHADVVDVMTSIIFVPRFDSV